MFRSRRYRTLATGPSGFWRGRFEVRVLVVMTDDTGYKNLLAGWIEVIERSQHRSSKYVPTMIPG